MTNNHSKRRTLKVQQKKKITQRQQTNTPNKHMFLHHYPNQFFEPYHTLSIVFHFFSGHLPINLQSAIRFIPVSFLPLLVSQAVVFCISLLYALLLVLLTHDVAELVHGTGLFFVAFPLLIVLIYLQVNWNLVAAIVVVE
ncbi:hypothetical protein JHK82_019566 [Glycine max]|nr:hypothetical protein JHK85_020007 [Glycine max]KAG5143871.1 hypothetical protein JHK82_019566 [Glycine max]